MVGGNKNYQKGVRKERKIVNAARAEGKIAFRSAGSHSPIDVCIIDLEAKTIQLIQSKPDGYKGEKLVQQYESLKGLWEVTFEVW
jgi:Holliday junction resolvase